MSYELAVILGFVFTALIIGYLAFQLDEKHYPLRIFLIVVSILILFTGVTAMRSIIKQVNVTSDSVNNTVDTLFKLVMWVMRILMAFAAIWLFVSTLNTFRDIKLEKHQARFGK